MAESTNKSNKEKDLKMLKVSYDMYENTKKSTEKNMKEALNQDGTKKYSDEAIKAKLELITTAQDEIVRDFIHESFIYLIAILLKYKKYDYINIVLPMSKNGKV